MHNRTFILNSCGHCILAMMRFPLEGDTRFFFFEKGFLNRHLFYFFLRENKIRKKTQNMTHNMEKRI